MGFIREIELTDLVAAAAAAFVILLWVYSTEITLTYDNTSIFVNSSLQNLDSNIQNS